ncbi:methyltransferase [Paramyrothecium foliicola]|nr:methyltransferase [Paramyrothecium foliicola]
MNAFFLSWELWQKLTFVLACCIVIVFAIGLFKLSRTNRLMRRLHELDEEKRIRASEIRHCGTSSWGPDEIPFGVRALQKGVHVEGIWISQSDTPEISQIASTTTLVVDTTEMGKIESRRTNSNFKEPRRTGYASGSTSMDDSMTADVLHETTQTTLVASVDEDLSAKKRGIKTRRISHSLSPVDTDYVTTYMPTGLQQRQLADDRGRKFSESGPHLGASCAADERTCLAEMPSRIPVPQRQGGGPMLFPSKIEGLIIYKKMNSIHNAATNGFSDAQAYDAHRPSYPTGAVDSLLKHLRVADKPGSKIIDLAAGTGKFTELLAQRGEHYEILAVEPHEKMRQTLVSKNLQGVEACKGTAEKMDVPDGWADAIIVAQAFHWFANKAALEEIHRVLKPGGKLAVIWNIENYNKPLHWQAETKWEQELNSLVHSMPTDGAPRFRQFVWADVFKQQAMDKPLFTAPLEDESVSWTVKLGREALWDRFNTLSQVAVLQGEDRKAFRAQYDAILDEGEGEGEGDWTEAGEIVVHGITYFAWTTKL